MGRYRKNSISFLVLERGGLIERGRLMERGCLFKNLFSAAGKVRYRTS